GTATIGTACDDGNASTGNDVYDANCNCVGQLIDCLGVAGGTATIGTACDDGNANTGNDVYDANCNCVGQLIDCLGVAGGSALPGSTCNDGDVNTTNDVYDANCVCAGTPIGGPCTGNQVVVNMTTDANPSDLSWEIRDGGGAVVASGAPALPNSLNSVIACLGNAPVSTCYTLNLHDSFGDGITNGGWELRTTGGKLLLRDDFAAGSESPEIPTAAAGYGSGHSFCLPEGPANIASYECGIFTNDLLDDVYCNKVTGATQYQFEFSNPDAGFIRRITRSTNYVYFWNIVSSPLVPGVHYFARVRTNVAGAITDAHWGSGCDLGLGVQEVVTCSQLIMAPSYGHSCDETRAFNPSTNNSFIYAKPVVGGTEYQFHIYNTTENYDQTFTRSTYILQLKWNSSVAPPLLNGSTYNVEINVKVNGLYSGFCPSTCTITINNGGGGNAVASMEPISKAETSLWPNPVRDGQVNLSIGGLKDADQRITVDVQDIYGKQVFTRGYDNTGASFSTVLQLSGDLASGVYMVNITVNGQRTVQRLSIIK
ncbi:MAG: T9SS type A sorting domain-containing protein, partial [Bacteroidetes bacterium]|nr:T9SS type A sorting domain-containing protein [Bacteroidota bacterium]